MQAEKTMNYNWNYRKWYVWVIFSEFFLLLAILGISFVLWDVPDVFKEREELLYMLCRIAAVLLGVIWTLMLSRAMLAMEIINNDSRYLAVRGQYMTTQKTCIFTGETAQTTAVILPVWITYPLATLVFSISFWKTVKKDEKLQRKYRTKEKYNAARKRVVKKTIEQLNQELGVFEFFSTIFFLFPYLVFLFYVFAFGK